MNPDYGPGAFFKTPRTAQARLLSKAEKRNLRNADPNSKAAEKRKADAAEARHRLNVKRKVWQRSSFCEFCGDSEQQTAEKTYPSTHDMHEVVFRSKTRNMEPDERFSTRICARLCRLCHEECHGERKIKPHFHNEALGMSGDYDVIDKDGLVIRSMRRKDLSKLNEGADW